MSEDWNNDHHNDHQHNNTDHYQGDQQPEHQHFEPAHEPVVTPTPEQARLDAIETAIQELRTGIDELKASLHPPAAEIAPEPIAESEPAEPAVVVDPHADRLTAIEVEIAHVRTLLGAMAQSMSTIAADITSHTDLHNETKSIVDEQHQLMRGLNYIITTAIGTLTTNAKSSK